MNAAALATRRTRDALHSIGLTPVLQRHEPGASPVYRARLDPTVVLVRTGMINGLPVTTVQVPRLPAAAARPVPEAATLTLRTLAMIHQARLDEDDATALVIRWPSAHVPSWR